MSRLNTNVAEGLLRLQALTQRLERAEVKKLTTVINQALLDIVRVVEKESLLFAGEAQTLTPVARERLKAIAKQNTEILQKLAIELDIEISGELQDFARMQTERISKSINHKLVGKNQLDIEFNRVPFESINTLVNKPIKGLTFAERLNVNSAESLAEIERSLVTSLTQGESSSKAIARVSQVLNSKVKQRATAIVRTEFNRVSNEVLRETFKENKDVIEKVVWLSALDDHVCPICQSLHGTELNPASPRIQPPAHPSCRCTMSPVMKAFDELAVNNGLDPNDPELQVFRDAYGDADLDGIPDNFEDFLKTQSAEFQRESLGDQRYDLWKQGVPYNELVSDTRVLKVSELESIADQFL